MGGRWPGPLLLVVLGGTLILTFLLFIPAAFEKWECSVRRIRESYTGLNLRWIFKSDGLPEDDPDSDMVFKLDYFSALTLILSFVVSALANAAGVGGGAFFVPMFNLLVGFSLKGATALSQAVITGGAVTSVAYGLSKRHPTLDKPLVDFNLALVLTPMMLLGVSSGVLFNRLLPNWLLTLMMTALLAALTNSTLRAGIRLYQAENKEWRLKMLAAAAAPRRAGGRRPRVYRERLPSIAEADETEQLSESETPLGLTPAAEKALLLSDEPSTSVLIAAIREGSGELPADDEELASNVGRGGDREEEEEVGSVPEEGEESESEPEAGVDVYISQEEAGWGGAPQRSTVWLSGLQLVAMWVGFLVLQFLKSRREQCSAAYGWLLAVQAAAALATTAFFIVSTSTDLGSRRSAGREPLLGPRSGDSGAGGGGPAQLPLYSPRQLLRCAAVILVGSCIAGLLGIGGGMILGPLLLGLGVHPLVTASTSAVLVLFSSSTATFAFAMDGRLNVQFALVYGVLCAFASLTGVTVVGMIVRRSGRTSLVVLILAVIIGLGGLLTALFGGIDAVQNVIAGEDLGFNRFCNKDF